MPDQTDVHVGRRLRERRWFLGLTQSQVGDRVGIKFQQVQKYETGQNRISASRLWDLSTALDVPVAYFYDGLSASDAEGVERSQHSEADRLGAELTTRLSDRETVELLRAYFALPDTPRRRLLELVRALSRLEMDEPVAAAPAELRRRIV